MKLWPSSGIGSLLFVIVAIVVSFKSGAEESGSHNIQKTYVLVHGAWGGGWGFKQLDKLITLAGHEVYRPTLTGLGERVHLASPSVGLETHIQDVVNLIEFEDLKNVILVGHSYGGMVVTGAADRIGERLMHLVYIDAHFPEHGQSMFDLIPAERKQRLIDIALKKGKGWLIPPLWENPGKDVPHPLATFQEPVNLSRRGNLALPGTYIHTLEPGATQDGFSASAGKARARGWPVLTLRTGHNPHWTMPDKLAEILLELN